MSRRRAIGLVFSLFVVFGPALRAATPTPTSVNPDNGNGASQTFTFTSSDADGFADIAGVNILFNSSFSGTSACWMLYQQSSNTLWLAGDDASTWAPGTVGSQATLQNTQCSIGLSAASAMGSGNSLTLTIPITFSPANFGGTKTIFMRAMDSSNGDSGYQAKGTFFVGQGGARFTVDQDPVERNVAAGDSTTFAFAISSINGFSGNVSFETLAPPAGVSASFNPPSPQFVAVNGSVSVTLTLATSASTPSGTSNVTVEFRSGDVTVQRTARIIVSNQAPDSAVSPSSGRGAGQTFTFVVTDPLGTADIAGYNILFNSTLNGANACWMFLDYHGNSNGTLWLANDDASAWSSVPISVNGGAAITLQNSQCSFQGNTSTIRAISDTQLELTMPLLFMSSFAGTKTIFIRTINRAGLDSGYLTKGRWTVDPNGAPPDFAISVAPSSQAVTAGHVAEYTVTITPMNGFAGQVDVTVAGLPPGATASGSRIFTSSSTPAGSYTLTFTGTSGALSHSTAAVLNVRTLGPPMVSVNPSSGTGATQTFSFVASDVDGGANVRDMNMLFNSSFSGMGGCWLAHDLEKRLWLASDNGSTWSFILPGSAATIQNSQCAISGSSYSVQDSGNDHIVTVGITFASSFAGNKMVFLRATNADSQDSGYQPVGTWTVP